MCKEKFLLGSQKIQCVNKYKYLGIELHGAGITSETVENIRNRALKAIFSLKGFSKYADIPPKLGLKLFNQLVKPICLYGAEIWGPIYLSKKNISSNFMLENTYDNIPVEKLYLKYCKQTLCVNKRATNIAVRGGLGAYPLSIDIILASLKFWNHASNSKNKLLQDSITTVQKSNDQPKTSWLKPIRDIYKFLRIQCNNKYPPKLVDIDKFRGRL